MKIMRWLNRNVFHSFAMLMSLYTFSDTKQHIFSSISWLILQRIRQRAAISNLKSREYGIVVMNTAFLNTTPKGEAKAISCSIYKSTFLEINKGYLHSTQQTSTCFITHINLATNCSHSFYAFDIHILSISVLQFPHSIIGQLPSFHIAKAT